MKDKVVQVPQAYHSPEIVNAAKLAAMDFPDPVFVVDSLLPEVGAAVLAAAPKMGKSWFALMVALAVASPHGRALGRYGTNYGDVLYVALEDTPRRLQNRQRMIMQEQPIPERLDFAVTWPPLPNGGLDCMRAWLTDHREARLVIVDTLEKVRVRDNKAQLYQQDYQTAGMLKGIADEYGICVLIIHHTRKMGSDDPLAQVSGTYGLTGAVDTVLVLRRERGQADAYLFATGRDIQERDLALRFDPHVGTWTALGDAEQYLMSEQRHRILTAVKAHGTDGATPKEVADYLDADRKEYDVIRQLMLKMVNDGTLRRLSSKYLVNNDTVNL